MEKKEVEKIKNIVNKYIRPINNNFFKISFTEQDRTDLEKQIVLAKTQYKDELDIDDLYLIRIVKDGYFPCNLTYHSIDERNSYQYIDNPFKFIIGYIAYKFDEYKNVNVGGKILKSDYINSQLVSYLYRDTKHFSINGLVSNIYQFMFKNVFDDGDMEIFEPLKNRITDKRLIILNPVDTFFDLHDEDMEISEDAYFLIREDKLEKIDFETLEELKDRKVFLFNGDTRVATDILLMHLGVLPQHSYQQSILREEIKAINGKWLSDFQYLNKFKNLIEDLNQKYLGMSYLNVPSDIAKNREKHFRDMIGIPGILHSETKYFNEEWEKIMDYKLDTYHEYINMIINLTKNIDKSVAGKIYGTVKDDVLKTGMLPIEEIFNSTYSQYEKLLFDILQDVSFPVFKEYTDNFNRDKILRIDKKRIG